MVLNPAPMRLLPVIALSVLALALAGCDRKPEAQAENARPVLVKKVHYEALSPERSLVGTIRPRNETDMGFRVGGKVAKRLVEVGDLVEPGQPLAMLDETDLKLQAEQADAELRAATGVVAQARAAEQRARDLRAKGWSTEAQLDQVKAAAEEAKGRVSRAERAVELTRNSLSYATLNATARGVVTATTIEPGQVVAAGQAAVRLARIEEKEVAVAIPETLVDRARSGQASVTLWSERGKTYEARLRELAPMADAATRTYLAKFSMPGAGDDVKLGMTATLTLCDSASERVARLPLSALLNQGTGASLFVADAARGSVTLKPVTVKAYEARDVLVSGGVEEGESVVVLGVQKLDPAQKVRVIENLSF